jgi:LysR family pca operon transcriptional activator
MDISRRIKIRHLEAFVEVARQKSVGRAAITLSLTQPAVTRTIRELEEIVGTASGRAGWPRHQAVASGRGFPVPCRFGLAAVRGGIAALANVATASGPPVRIGALPTVSATVMPGAVVISWHPG